MSEQLLHYYNEQLSYLRKQGKAFAKAHPKIAGHLQLGSNESEDPLVERLLEGFAFLAGRVQHNIDQGNQIITENLLNLICPQFHRPVPAFGILQCQPTKQLEQELTIKKHTLLRTAANSLQLTFRTCYPLYLSPLDLSNIEWKRNFHNKPIIENPEIKSCLSFTLKTLKSGLTIKKINSNKIRIYINPENSIAYKIYEILNTQIAEININSKIKIPNENLKFIGLEEDEIILPYSPNICKSYGLLTEFFSCPKKFLFFDIDGLAELAIPETLTEIQINIFLTICDNESEKAINDTFFLLNCVPVINLFPQQAEPIRVDHTQVEYHIVPENHADISRYEIYSVESMLVASANASSEKIYAMEYFSKKYSLLENTNYLYWHLKHKSCWELGEYHLAGSETFVTFSMPDKLNYFQQHLLVTPELLCTNREATLMINDNSKFEFYPDVIEDNIFYIKLIGSLSKPRYREKSLNKELELLTHLSMNQLAYATNNSAIEVLKNTLHLYNIDNKNEHLLIDKGILDIKTRIITKRSQNTLKQNFYQGIEYTLLVDEQYFSEKNYFLFSQVLQFFLQKMCSINSFVQLILETKQRGLIKKWPSLIGTKKIL